MADSSVERWAALPSRVRTQSAPASPDNVLWVLPPTWRA